MSPHVPRVTSSCSKGGFTLLEVVVAIVILMVGLLAMLQAINLSIATNLQNEMRTRGTMIGEDQMARIKSLPFANITATGEKSVTVPVSLRSSLVQYTVTKKVDEVSSSTKRVNVGVRWHHRGNIYEHVVSSVIAEPTTR
ncbi:MAG: prepilin-type N-terminal cleavage/methylation domain-containing protein [Geobacteraceae bacterium]|nr:prepilin-type N-terminal cleavage/methylation domain-containing protein [Geobacteraceae bacterium]